MDRYDDLLETAMHNFEAALKSLGPEAQAKQSSPTLWHLSNGLRLLTRGMLQEREVLDAKLKELSALLASRR
jgi:hypothetical protein